MTEVYSIALGRFRAHVTGRAGAGTTPGAVAERETLAAFLKAHCRFIVLGAVGALHGGHEVGLGERGGGLVCVFLSCLPVFFFVYVRLDVHA
jgi:hypothetical protein